MSERRFRLQRRLFYLTLAMALATFVLGGLALAR